MIVWRLASGRFSPLDGGGGLVAAGRWNSLGNRIAYTSGNLSLCVLEQLVHIDLEDVPDDYTAFKIEMPDDLPVGTVSLSDLPDGWHEVDHPHCRKVGDQWIQDKATPVLRVPSSVILHEPNFLLSPIHPQAQHIQVVEQHLFTFAFFAV